VRRLLDADVLIGALDRRDAHHESARRLLTAWRQQEDAVTISVVNLSEVLTAPAAARARLGTAREAIGQAPAAPSRQSSRCLLPGDRQAHQIHAGVV
jgi:predicted nucleic acid-binding protein